MGTCFDKQRIIKIHIDTELHNTNSKLHSPDIENSKQKVKIHRSNPQYEIFAKEYNKFLPKHKQIYV